MTGDAVGATTTVPWAKEIIVRLYHCLQRYPFPPETRIKAVEHVRKKCLQLITADDFKELGKELSDIIHPLKLVQVLQATCNTSPSTLPVSTTSDATPSLSITTSPPDGTTNPHKRKREHDFTTDTAGTSNTHPYHQPTNSPPTKRPAAGSPVCAIIKPEAVHACHSQSPFADPLHGTPHPKPDILDWTQFHNPAGTTQNGISGGGVVPSLLNLVQSIQLPPEQVTALIQGLEHYLQSKSASPNTANISSRALRPDGEPSSKPLATTQTSSMNEQKNAAGAVPGSVINVGHSAPSPALDSPEPELVSSSAEHLATLPTSSRHDPHASPRPGDESDPGQGFASQRSAAAFGPVAYSSTQESGLNGLRGGGINLDSTSGVETYSSPSPWSGPFLGTHNFNILDPNMLGITSCSPTTVPLQAPPSLSNVPSFSTLPTISGAMCLGSVPGFHNLPALSNAAVFNGMHSLGNIPALNSTAGLNHIPALSSAACLSGAPGISHIPTLNGVTGLSGVPGINNVTAFRWWPTWSQGIRSYLPPPGSTPTSLSIAPRMSSSGNQAQVAPNSS